MVKRYQVLPVRHELGFDVRSHLGRLRLQLRGHVVELPMALLHRAVELRVQLREVRAVRLHVAGCLDVLGLPRGTERVLAYSCSTDSPWELQL